MPTENTPMHRKLVIDYRLVAEGYLFASNRDRCLYLGKSVSEKPHWLEVNVGGFRPLADVEKEVAQLGAPGENKNSVEAARAELNGQTSAHDVAKKDDDENDVASVDTLECSPSHEPAPLPASEIIKNETMPLEPLRRAKVTVSETEGSRTETAPVGAIGGKGGRSAGRQIKKQKQPEEVANSGRMLSPERMRIVLDSLRECPILWVAAAKAGIHRRTLEYWIKCSWAGDARYDIEWQGEIWRFHEHCESAIEEAHDRLRAVARDIAMGGVIYKIDQSLVDLGFEGSDAYLRDEHGNPVVETIRQPNGKMLRFILEWERSEIYGKNRKIDIPRNSGVLVVGGIRHDTPSKVNNCTASVKARKWKSLSRMIQKTKV
jgi:hypothetical protein